ncbi:flavodoxin domain-containing protein [Arcobacter sp. CECT 8985]|uniref:flavodoxin domain-containing protein n=1 Tax=Arcobacter sp. CECT 8985 TaxID=1935424 RepID=UPI00100C2554|nr:flavodoxin domain-containing protein [Arcobacter sp. CECT 8985]RXJ87855.1 flavodoxin [Arcobacter sp. CECT 8985]
MANIGIFCATAGGTSLKIADKLAKAFNVEEDNLINMEEDFDDVDQLLDYDILFIGSSTWGQGDVHHEWVDPQLDIDSDEIDFSGKKVAFFGAGDCVKHGEHFCSALGKLYKTFTKAGADIIGFVDASDYSYEYSLSQVGDKLCGLAIDEHNEKGKTEERIENWIESLKKEISK